MSITYIKYVLLKPYKKKTQWKKSLSEGKRIHISYNLYILQKYNVLFLMETSFEISESPHLNVAHQFFKGCGK